MEIKYEPTLPNITLTPEKESIFVQAIKHIMDSPTALKKTTRAQFWFNQIWNHGRDEAIKDIVKHLKKCDLPIPIEAWSPTRTKEEFSSDVIKCAIEEIKTSFT